MPPDKMISTSILYFLFFSSIGDLYQKEFPKQDRGLVREHSLPYMTLLFRHKTIILNNKYLAQFSGINITFSSFPVPELVIPKGSKISFLSKLWYVSPMISS